jgi:molybdopterin-guanine dinucleotide biosynthesis protein A
MGSDKALLMLDGERLVDRAARRLASVSNPVLVACGRRRLAIAGCITVDDAIDGAGPLAAIVAGLRLSPHVLTAVVAVDMPWFDPELLGHLAREWRGEDALVPVSPSGAEPLHAVYARSALPAMDDALTGGRLRMRDLLDRLVVRTFAATTLMGSERGQGFAVNLNTPDDALMLVTPPRPGDA